MDWKMQIVVCVAMIGISIIGVNGKIYERCELARELRDVHEIPDNQLATWVCIARHESEYNTSAINPGSGDHGLFQISQLFWCSPPGYACGVSCDDLRNEDIEDDVICARRVFREHKRISGDGFNAWVVYNLYCRDKHYAKSFLDGCFGPGVLKTSSEDFSIEEKPLPTVDYYPQFKKKTTTVETTKKLVTTTPKQTTVTRKSKPLTTTLKSTTVTRKSKPVITTSKPTTVTRKSKPTKVTTRNPTITTTRKVKSTQKLTKPVVTSETTTSGTTKQPVQQDKDGKNQVKLLRPTEENDEFTYAISKTGYKFTRF